VTVDINGRRRGSVSNSKDNFTADAVSEQLVQLTKQFTELDKRLQNVEKRLDNPIASSSLPKYAKSLSEMEGKEVFQGPSCTCGLSVARARALASMNRALISSKPLNLKFSSKVRNACVVMKRNPFALFQLLLMILTIAGLLVFVILAFRVAYDSTTSEFKPIKVERKDVYFGNEDLAYKFPLHYIAIEEVIPSLTEFYTIYNDRFGIDCASSVETCFNDLFEDWDWNDAIETVECTTMDQSVVIPSRKITVTNEVYAVEPWTWFSFLIKVEYNDFQVGESDDWPTCKIVLDWTHSIFQNTTRQIHFWFFVSRVDYPLFSSRPAESNWREAIHRFYDLESKFIVYEYVESTIDGVSEFTADVDETAMPYSYNWISIETRSWPTVTHWGSYATYSYTNWLADVGGFFSLVVTLFFVLTKKVMVYSNRHDPFHSQMGILPFISMTYRNAEMIAGVRCLLVSALGISEGEYFADESQAILNDQS